MEAEITKITSQVAADLVQLSRLGKSRLWVDYDKPADILYVNFGRPQKADDAVQENGIIKRKRGGKIVGLTILNASRVASNK